ncbi:MAG: hypothetical protein LBK08_09575 [Treponema sp.]|nr:hypothetical protein [Treponema sp.]
MGFTTAEKKIAAEFAPRCRKAGKQEKSRILDEYFALSGSKSRKYAVFKLNRIGKTQLRGLDGQTVTVKTAVRLSYSGEYFQLPITPPMVYFPPFLLLRS